MGVIRITQYSGIHLTCVTFTKEIYMESDFARPLNSNDLAFNFLTKALSFSDIEADETAQHIMKAERLLETMDLKSILESKENRRPLYKEDEKRKNLRRKIFDELIDLDRLDDDELIRLGTGGAKPRVAIKSDREAILLTGLPASGKSSIANKIADLYGAYVVDSDYAKRKIPEFGHEFGASIVHEESSLITFGSKKDDYDDEYNLFEFCIAKGFNMVIPKIGNNCSSVEKMRDALIHKGYKVHLILISLDRKVSCKRALYRYLETSRYVPLGLVFDQYGNEPILTYYRVRDSDDWESVGKVSTLNLRDNGPEIIHSKNNGPLETLKLLGGEK